MSVPARRPRRASAVAAWNAMPGWDALINALPMDVFVANGEGMVLAANVGLCARLAQAPRGMAVLALCVKALDVDSDDLPLIAQCLARATSGGAHGAVLVRLRTRGGKHWIELRVAPIGYGRDIALLLTVDDISRTLHLEQRLDESQQARRQLVAQGDQIKESERKRIARDIHDDLGQNMLALRIDATLLQARSRPDSRLHARVGEAIGHIDATIGSVRTIINSLRPPVLDLGLGAAIDWQAREFGRRTRIACTVIDAFEPRLALDDMRATALFRMVQEMLSNVARHARATKVRLELQSDSECVSIKLIDNGIGIAPGCRRGANSFGLLGVSERVSALQGSLRITDTEDCSGTTVSITIPLAGGEDGSAA